MKYPEPYQRDDSSYYQFKYRSPDGKYRRRSTGSTTKKEAREFIKSFMDRLYTQRSLLPLKSYAADFFIWDKCPRTLRRRSESNDEVGRVWIDQSRSRLTRLIFTDPLAKIPINQITRGDILDFRQRLISAEHGSNTVNKTMQNLTAIFSEAVYRGDLANNPATRISQLKHTTQTSNRRGSFTLDELRALFADNPGHWVKPHAYAAALLSATIGLREGEIAALSWDQFSGNRITIDRDIENGSIKMWPKNHDRREIIIPPRLKQILLSASESDSLLFPNRSGRPRSYTFFRKRTIAALGSAGIPIESPDGPRVFHSLRHSCNSLLTLHYKAPPIAVQLVLGWKTDLEAIQRNYTHMVDTLRKDVLSASTQLLYDILTKK